MTLSAEQRAAVSQWIAAGDSLAAVQRKLTEELKVSMTYMEVRFLVDDLSAIGGIQNTETFLYLETINKWVQQRPDGTIK